MACANASLPMTTSAASSMASTLVSDMLAALSRRWLDLATNWRMRRSSQGIPWQNVAARSLVARTGGRQPVKATADVRHATRGVRLWWPGSGRLLPAPNEVAFKAIRTGGIRHCAPGCPPHRRRMNHDARLAEILPRAEVAQACGICCIVEFAARSVRSAVEVAGFFSMADEAMRARQAAVHGTDSSATASPLRQAFVMCGEEEAAVFAGSASSSASRADRPACAAQRHCRHSSSARAGTRDRRYAGNRAESSPPWAYRRPSRHDLCRKSSASHRPINGAHRDDT